MPKVHDKTRPTQKRCAKCGIVKPYTEEFFFRNASHFYGLSSYCKKCSMNGLNKNGEPYIWRRKERHKQHLCVACGLPPIPHSTRWCLKHWFMKIAYLRMGRTHLWEELKALADAQGYRCAYTGEVLVPGANMSLDHKLPVSRYLESKSDIDNVHWVTYAVNRMKSDLTHEEFLRLCHQVCETVETN